jgi:hypothetical protein
MSNIIHRHAGGEPPVVLDRGWVCDPRLTFGTLGVLVVLHALWSAGEPLSCEALCERSEATEARIRHALAHLEAAGYVEWHGETMLLTSPYEQAVAAAVEAARPGRRS